VQAAQHQLERKHDLEKSLQNHQYHDVPSENDPHGYAEIQGLAYKI